MRGIHIRIENAVYQAIEQMAQARDINISQLCRELIDMGLRVKKHMENKKSDAKDEATLDQNHLEVGASSAIEALLLLRKMAKQLQPEWVTEAHEEALQKIQKMAE